MATRWASTSPTNDLKVHPDANAKEMQEQSAIVSGQIAKNGEAA